jgi:hypothetical protein
MTAITTNNATNNTVLADANGFDCNFALDNVQRSLTEFLKSNPEQLYFCVAYQKIDRFSSKAIGGHDECFPIELGLAKHSQHRASCGASVGMLMLSAEMMKNGKGLIPIAFRWDDLPAVIEEKND